MSDSEPPLEPNPEPTEWLAVPPTGVTGCPLEDWLGALCQHGFEAVAKREPEGVWLHFGESCPIEGFVSIEQGLVEAINFELREGTTHAQSEQLRRASDALAWEIWDQDTLDDDEWFDQQENDDD